MKYAVVLYDGMADLPVPALGGRTPMEVAQKPVFDRMSRRGEVGLVRTVAPGLKPGSDVANLSVLGYDPSVYYTGRSPLEAVSIGIDMAPNDIALRCNLVTLSEDTDYRDKTMLDYSADDISSEEAAELIHTIQEHFGDSAYDYYSGVSYRHCLIHHGGSLDLGNLVPPHDISGKVIGPYLSTNKNARMLMAMMETSYKILENHPVNIARKARGRKPANAIWLWGEGSRPNLPNFQETFGVSGSIISAVDLLKGIGICAGMHTPEVPGATGYIDTNFRGKAETAVAEWRSGQDFVYIHIEAPDECGHRNEPQNKVRSIELIDEQVLPILLDYLETQEDYKLMILPDHPTPIITGTHSSDPVPYLIYQKSKEITSGVDSIDEQSAAGTGNFMEVGHALMRHFLTID